MECYKTALAAPDGSRGQGASKDGAPAAGGAFQSREKGSTTRRPAWATVGPGALLWDGRGFPNHTGKGALSHPELDVPPKMRVALVRRRSHLAGRGF